jgi:hypothetical protein
MKTLPWVSSEMALHVLAYNLTRVMNIMHRFAGSGFTAAASSIALARKARMSQLMRPAVEVNRDARDFVAVAWLTACLVPAW